MGNEIELKPCPFCEDGGTVETSVYLTAWSRVVPYYAAVMCMDCRVAVGEFGSTEENAQGRAVKRWNTRRKETCTVSGYGNMSGSDMPCSYCDECGGEVPEGAKFCPDCGLEVVRNG